MADANFVNRTMFLGDNLFHLRGINTGSVDLVYLDPPFNSGKEWKGEGGMDFTDVWTGDQYDEQWFDELRSVNPDCFDFISTIERIYGKRSSRYLLMMSVRLVEMRRVLKPTGSIYLHCDWREAHSLKLLMDSIFGKERFRNEIVWCYSTGGASKKKFAAKHDTILVYGKSGNVVFNTLRVPYTSAMSRDPKYRHRFHPDGKIMLDWWNDISPVNPQAKERVGWATQKPVKLLERIIQASSNPGDVVLDPFAGCGTACEAAENLGRRWIAIERNEKIVAALEKRLSHDGLLNGDRPVVVRKYPRRTDLPSYRIYKSDLLRDEGKICQGCGSMKNDAELDIDHIIPKARGGSDERGNLQLLCRECNIQKGKGHMTERTAQILGSPRDLTSAFARLAVGRLPVEMAWDVLKDGLLGLAASDAGFLDRFRSDIRNLPDPG